jgi:hypothetical protein
MRGLVELTYIGKLRGVNLASSTAVLIAKGGQEVDSFSMHDAAIHKKMEIHEKEVERVGPATASNCFRSIRPFKHSVHPLQIHLDWPKAEQVFGLLIRRERVGQYLLDDPQRVAFYR